MFEFDGGHFKFWVIIEFYKDELDSVPPRRRRQEVTLYIRTVTLYHVIFAPRSLNSQFNNKRFQNSELSSRLCAERFEKPSDAKRACATRVQRGGCHVSSPCLTRSSHFFFSTALSKALDQFQLVEGAGTCRCRRVGASWEKSWRESRSVDA